MAGGCRMSPPADASRAPAREGFRQAMAWLHTWAGLLLGWLLFAIFVTGTLSYFKPEFNHWMRPELQALPPAKADDAAAVAERALATLRQHAPQATQWIMRLPDERNAVLLVGFQAEGTRGRALADGARELKMHGRYIGVRAEVASVPAFSVHADRDEIVAWLRRMPRAPETVFVVHGEPAAATALHDAIEDQLRWTAAVPRYLELVRVD